MSATVHEMALMALAEVNPRAHDALADVGANRAGHPKIGLLAALPRADLVDACRAVHLAHREAGNHLIVGERGYWPHTDPERLADQIIDDASRCPGGGS